MTLKSIRKTSQSRDRLQKITPVKVFVTKGYWLGKYEVSQSEWIQVMNTEPWKNQRFTKEGADYPATFVSWNDAADFCLKLTEQERQPDACRTTGNTRFHGGPVGAPRAAGHLYQRIEFETLSSDE